MTADLLFRALLGHLVGDYLFQNDWMALNKKENNLACVVHGGCRSFYAARTYYGPMDGFAYRAVVILVAYDLGSH